MIPSDASRSPSLPLICRSPTSRVFFHPCVWSPTIDALSPLALLTLSKQRRTARPNHPPSPNLQRSLSSSVPDTVARTGKSEMSDAFCLSSVFCLLDAFALCQDARLSEDASRHLRTPCVSLGCVLMERCVPTIRRISDATGRAQSYSSRNI